MFRVVWSDPALDELASVYVTLDLATQNRVAAGLDSLNRRLADNPLEVGESRDANQRVAFSALLVVRYRVDTASRIVRVFGVSRYGH